MKYSYAIPMLLTALLVTTKALAYDDYDEDDFSIADASLMILFGGGFMLAGFLIAQIKLLEGVAKGLLILGMFVAGIAILNVALMILSWAVTTAVTLALYVGGLFVVGYIFYSIYQWLFTKRA